MMRPNKKCKVSFEELLDFSDGLGEAAGLRAHLADGCEACGARLAEIGRLQSVLRQGELTSAPEHVVARARDLFRERFEKPARRSLFAQLVFDSRSRMALAGARGAESGQIQALFSTDEHDVDIWQERAPNGLWYVIGQVLPKDGGAPIAPDVAVLDSPTGLPIEAAREGTEFHLPAVPAGTYTLRLTLPDAEVSAEGVVIGV